MDEDLVQIDECPKHSAPTCVSVVRLGERLASLTEAFKDAMVELRETFKEMKAALEKQDKMHHEEILSLREEMKEQGKRLSALEKVKEQLTGVKWILGLQIGAVVAWIAKHW
jgi:hypothetical protein